MRGWKRERIRGILAVVAGWTDFVVAHRGRILALWLVLFVLGGFGAANLGGLLSNRFSVPGSESERGLVLLEDRMGVRSDGAFRPRRGPVRAVRRAELVRRAGGDGLPGDGLLRWHEAGHAAR